jgi:hypothetical protein
LNIIKYVWNYAHVLRRAMLPDLRSDILMGAANVF